MEKDLNKHINLIRRGTVEIIQLDELRRKIKKAIESGTPLIVKAGFDPTAPDIHLGHTVLLRKLKHFQDLGHQVHFLIGDATAIVGDPSGQSQTRTTLTWDEIKKNVMTYVDQVSNILDTDERSGKFKLVYNSAWFSNYRDTKKPPPFTFDNFVELAQRYTIARLLERDDFEKRYNENRPISFLELFYPLMQGYDSVKMRSDVELGGNDQKFNMLVGRDLQGAYGQEAQAVITMPILEGLDGVKKMSKSLDNYVGINEPPDSMYGKLMSISDEIMIRYYELLTDEDVDAIKKGIQKNTLHPMDAKKSLAAMIVGEYHGKEKALKAAENFGRAFSQKGFPENIPLITKEAGGAAMPLVHVLSQVAGLTKSNGEAKRKIQEGAVEVNGKKIQQVDFAIQAGKEYRIRLGKKFARVLLTTSSGN
ncbi:MAG: tyrosine--tRNA ligase [Candidatus Omnitrophota bacterium]